MNTLIIKLRDWYGDGDRYQEQKNGSRTGSGPGPGPETFSVCNMVRIVINAFKVPETKC